MKIFEMLVLLVCSLLVSTIFQAVFKSVPDGVLNRDFTLYTFYGAILVWLIISVRAMVK